MSLDLGSTGIYYITYDMINLKYEIANFLYLSTSSGFDMHSRWFYIILAQVPDVCFFILIQVHFSKTNSLFPQNICNSPKIICFSSTNKSCVYIYMFIYMCYSVLILSFLFIQPRSMDPAWVLSIQCNVRITSLWFCIQMIDGDRSALCRQ